MKTVPLPDLPWQAQLMFWVLMLLVGVLLGFAVWFLVRYVKGQDDINSDNTKKFDAITKKIEDVKSSLSSTITNNAAMVTSEIRSIEKTVLTVRQDTLTDIGQIKDDVREAKGVVKLVETHHAILKTVVVKLQNLMIIKGEKPKKD